MLSHHQFYGLQPQRGMKEIRVKRVAPIVTFGSHPSNACELLQVLGDSCAKTGNASYRNDDYGSEGILRT